MAMNFKIEVGSSSPAFLKDAKKVKKALLHALDFLKKDNVYLEAFLVEEKDIKQMNKIYRGIDKETSVLSFEEPKGIPHPPNALKFLGEIYLAPRVIKRNNEDISYLAIHGLLHLLGYTHKSKDDTIEMESLEKKIWQKL